MSPHGRGQSLENSYIEKNNILHKTSIINDRTGLDLGELVTEKSFNLNEFIMNRDGGFQPNNSTIKFKLDRGSTDFIKKGDKLRFIDIFNEASTEFFQGYVVKEPTTAVKNGNIEVTVEVKDNTFNLLEKTAQEDIFFQGWYICNSTQKATSLLHYLATEMGYLDTEIDFEDIVYNGVPVEANIIKIDKGAVLLQEFAEACRAAEARFHQVGNKLVVRSYLNEASSGYVFDERNVLNQLQTVPQEAQYSNVKVTYSKITKRGETMVWALVGEGGEVDKANIKISPGTTTENNKKFWDVDFKPSGVVSSYKAPEIVAKLADGNTTPLEYDLDIDRNGGTLKLYNTLTEDVFLEKFKIMGEPVVFLPGNSITYPADTSKKTNQPPENKYIQNVSVAAIKAKNTFNFECLDFDRVIFDTNVSRWLLPGMVCTINHQDYKNPIKEVIIESIVRKAYSERVTARTYRGPVSAGDLEEREKSVLVDTDTGKPLDNVVEVDPGTPPAPVILSTDPNVGGIVTQLQEYTWKGLATFEFRLTMVEADNTPTEPGVELCFAYKTTRAPVVLTDPNYYNKRWRVEARAVDLSSKISEWSQVTASCYAVSLRMPSDGIERHSITTEHLKFSNNDGLYVDTDGFLRVASKFLILDGETQVNGMLGVFGGGKGIVSYDGTTEENSTKKIVIDGGEIAFWEKV